MGGELCAPNAPKAILLLTVALHQLAFQPQFLCSAKEAD